MAAEEMPFQQDVCEEMTCAVCLDCFKHPVVIPECGHNFCQACLDQCWGKLDSEVSCPQCRLLVQRRMVTPNRPLANLINIANKSRLYGRKRAKELEAVCGKHAEPQKLFCQDDRTLICVVCDRSKEHKKHKVIPLEEASEGYKEQIKADREKTVMTFRQAHQFLEEQEKLLLAQIEEVMEWIEREKESRLITLSEKLQSLESIIQETEEKLQQSTVDLLQDLDSFLNKCQAEKSKSSGKFPGIFPVALKWRTWDFCDTSYFLEGIVKQFQDSFISGLQLQKANVHFNPDSAYLKLRVSRDYKNVIRTQMHQNVTDSPERFDKCPVVLGCEEFTKGRHFWEFSVADEDGWAVGVARKSLERKGELVWGPEGGIWPMGKWKKAYRSSSTAPNAILSLSEEPRKIRVALNYEGGRVAFYDADRGTLICAYSGVSFDREIICPFFYLLGTVYMTMCS
uniref:RING-type E3 ubiquitin transferase n=1 Tax=Salvator merianae TaxID=96440 RepID=A0A8D0KF60_SALMN